MKQLKIIGVLLGLLATLNMAGCATIMSGGPTKINITSNPPGAKVTVTGTTNGEKEEGITPFTTWLYKNSDYKLNFEIQGYNPETVNVKRSANLWITGDFIVGFVLPNLMTTAAKSNPVSYDIGLMLGAILLSVSGIIGGITDISSNNISQHDKDHIDLTLTKVGSASSAAIPIGKN